MKYRKYRVETEQDDLMESYATASAASGNPLPDFKYLGVILDPDGLKYRPKPDLIHPSVIAAPPSWRRAPAKYLMYYAPHDAPGGLCLALAQHPEGPWVEHECNPIIGHDWRPHFNVSHVSSPHAIWNQQEQRLFLYFHGENDTTRYAISDDGVRFEYGGVAVDTGSFEPGLSEASYARVFAHRIAGMDNRYVMTIMGNHNGTRKVYLAWSADGQRWQGRPQALVCPPAGSGQMGPGWLLPWPCGAAGPAATSTSEEGKQMAVNQAQRALCGDARATRLLMITFANTSDSPTYDPVSDLYLHELEADCTGVRCLGKWIDHRVAGIDNHRINDPCMLQEGNRLYLFVNVGRRLNQKIGLAVAQIEGRGPATSE